MTSKGDKLRQLEILKAHASTLRAFNSLMKEPHAGQREIRSAVFKDKIKQLFVQCGRRWGKSESAIDIARRWAYLYPGSHIYIICPLKSQAKEIYWSSDRLRSSIPDGLLLPGKAGRSKNELRLIFKNCSFIKLDGADNVDALRGITPDLVLIDEYKDVKRDFAEAIEPALISKNAPLVILGTPPKVRGLFSEKRDYVLEMSGKDSSFKFLRKPTSSNPHIPKAWLKKKEAEYRDRGEYGTWKREFLAEDAYEDGGYVFPMFNSEHVKSESFLREYLRKDLNKIAWVLACDPGSTSAFGALLMGVNRNLGQLVILDEVFETSPMKTSTGNIYPLIAEMPQRFGVRDVPICYDEAAAWFRGELVSQFGINAFPSQKRVHDKMSMISMLKDFMLKKGGLLVCDRCVNLIRELTNYAIGNNGKIVKKDDHLVDAKFYGMGFLGASPAFEPEEIKRRSSRRLEQNEANAYLEAGFGTSEYDNEDYISANPSDLDWLN